MEIKASSKYDYKTFASFQRFHFRVRLKILNILIFILTVFVAFVFTITAIYSYIDSQMIFGGTIFVVMLVGMLFTYFCMPKILYKRDKVNQDAENNFVFKEKIEITSKNNYQTTTATLEYDAIWRIYENKNYIYMFLDPNKAEIVDKSTVTGGTITDLRMLLISKIGADKYKIKCKA